MACRSEDSSRLQKQIPQKYPVWRKDRVAASLCETMGNQITSVQMTHPSAPSFSPASIQTLRAFPAVPCASYDASIQRGPGSLTLPSAAQLTNFSRIPAETCQILAPLLILVLKKFDSQWLGPRPER